MPARVLVVDDNPIVRSSICDLLHSEPGWEVCGQAANGSEAIERAHNLHPDLIVMDLMMPRVGGLQATREIVRENPGIRILILTLYDYPSLDSEARAAGASACLRKGQSGTALLDVLHELTFDATDATQHATN